MPDIRKLTERYVVAFNNRDLDAVAELFADSFSLTDSEVHDLRPKNRVINYVDRLFARNPELVFEAHKIIVEGNTSAIHFSLNSREYRFEGIDLISWENGKMITMHAYLTSRSDATDQPFIDERNALSILREWVLYPTWPNKASSYFRGLRDTVRQEGVYKDIILYIFALQISNVKAFMSIKQAFRVFVEEEGFANIEKQNYFLALIAVCLRIPKDEISIPFVSRSLDHLSTAWVSAICTSWLVREERPRSILLSQKAMSERPELRVLKEDIEACYPQFLENSSNNGGPFFISQLPQGRKLKVSLCVSGQLRGNEEAFGTWKGLFTDEVEVDIFVHSWKNPGASLPIGEKSSRYFSEPDLEIYRKIEIEIGAGGIRDRFKNFFKSLEFSSEISADKVAEFYQAKRVVLEDDTMEPFASFSNSEKMYYKMCQAQKLARDFDSYDLSVRIRPDMKLGGKPVDYQGILFDGKANNALHTGSNFYFAYYGFGIDDKLAVGASWLIDQYASVWSKNKDSSHRFIGHNSLARHLREAGVHARKNADLQNAGFTNLIVKGGSHISDALENDLKARKIDEYDKALLSLFRNYFC